MKKQGFKITLNRELSNKLIQKNSLPQRLMSHSLGISKNISEHQNKDTHSVTKSWKTDRL